MARIAESAPREAGPRVRLAIASRAATRRGSPDASQTVPWETGRAARPRGEPKSAVSRAGALLRPRADSTARRREAGNGPVRGGKQPEPSAGGMGRRRSRVGDARSRRQLGRIAYFGRGQRTVASLCWSQCTDGEVRADEDQEPPRTDHRGAARANHRTHRGFRPCLADGDRSCPSAARTPFVRRWTDAVGRVRSPRCRACVPGGQAGWVAGRALVRAGACWGYDGSSLHDRGLRGREVRGDLA